MVDKPQIDRALRLLQGVAEEPDAAGTANVLLELASILDQPLKPDTLASRIAAAFRGLSAHIGNETHTTEELEAIQAEGATQGARDERKTLLDKLGAALLDLDWTRPAWVASFVRDFESDLPEIEDP